MWTYYTNCCVFAILVAAGEWKPNKPLMQVIVITIMHFQFHDKQVSFVITINYPIRDKTSV